MNRGYFKFWRKAEDSVSWSRGLLYQGLMINFLRRANWKVGYFQGKKILPGQFACSYESLAEEFKLPKTTIHRMIANLKEDNFIMTVPVERKFTLVSVVNWGSYQICECPAGTQTEHKRNSNGTQTECIKEDKNIYISPLTPLSGGDEPPLELAEVTHDERTRERENAMFADCPTGSVNNACGTARKQEPTPEGKKVTEKKKASRKPKGADLPPYSDWFEECWKVYPNRNGKGPAWRAFYELQQEGELPEDLQLRIEYRALEDDWKENVKVPGRLRFIPRMASWLHARGWEDEGCFCEPDPRNTPEDARRNAIMAKYSFGMPRAGESPQEVLARCARMDAELEAEGLL